MTFFIVDGPIVGFTQFEASFLERITRRLRACLRSLIDTLNQRGQP